MKHLVIEFFPTIYCLFIIFASVCFYRSKLSQRGRRGIRGPLPEDIKILRSPGESQKRLLGEAQESLYGKAPLWSLLALGVAAIPVAAAALLRAGEGLLTTAMIASTLCLVFLSIIQIRWFVRSISEIRQRRLGWFGERVVGEILDGLKARGFYVFHDLPTSDPTQPYNIDHVVVGPTGLFAIETKTYSKQPGFTRLESHEVAFTGDRLVFPWGEKRDELDQACKHAANLTRELRPILAEPVEASPILVLPGWYVRSDSHWPMVLNHKRVAVYILRQRRSMLSPRQIARIAQHLDNRCRDVEY